MSAISSDHATTLIEIVVDRHRMNPKCQSYKQTIYSCPDPLCRDAVRILELNPSSEGGRKAR